MDMELAYNNTIIKGFYIFPTEYNLVMITADMWKALVDNNESKKVVEKYIK